MESVAVLVKPTTHARPPGEYARPERQQIGETAGRIKGTGVRIRQQLGAVYSDFRAGMIGEFRNVLTWRQALEAAGR